VRETDRFTVRRLSGESARLARGVVRAVGAIAGSLLILTSSGCGGRNPLLSYGPNPRVEDCAQIQQATPTKYVCGGKVYTSIQLSAIRNGTQQPQ
jgi:hypothetical protein